MTTTYRDYLWLKDEPYNSWTGNGYLVSLIRDASTTDVLDSLGAFNRRPHGTGYDGFTKRVSDFESLELVQPMERCAQTVGVADIGGGWVLMIQHNSDYLGVDGRMMQPIIDSHEVVSHFSNVNADARFVWWRDGECQVSFDSLLPGWDLDAAAAAPTAGSPTVLGLIDEVGGIERDSDGTRTEFFHVEGAFALAERLTGVAVTKELLESGNFIAAIVPTVLDSPCRMDHELPASDPVFGDAATWGEVARLYRSSAETTVHGTFVLTETGNGSDEVTAVEIWHTPFGFSRQTDDDGLVEVTTPQGHWHRGPYSPQADPHRFFKVHRRWNTPMIALISDATPADPTEVAGRRAWKFDLPPAWDRSPITVSFDAETGVVLRVQTLYRTEELGNITVGEDFDEELFRHP